GSYFDSSGYAWCYTYACIQDSVNGLPNKSVYRFVQKGIAPVAIIDRQLPFEYTIAGISTDVMVVCQVGSLNTFDVVSSKTRWIKEVPIKVNILAWKVKINGLPTRLNLSKRGIDIESILCPICEQHVESVSHIFFTCHLSREIFRGISRWWQIDASDISCYEEWLHWLVNLRISSNHRKLLEGVFFVSWWSMFERQKLSGNNFNDWFHQLKLILRVEKKMHVIEQPIPPAHPADSAANVLAKWNAVYDAHNEDLSVGLVLNGLTSDFARFVRNYNMHNMGKTIGELHVLLIEYEKGLPKKAVTPQLMAIQGGRIQKANKKSLNAKGNGNGKGMGKDKSYITKPKHLKPNAKEHPTKNDACHHCKEVGIFTIELYSFPIKSWVYNTGCGTHICITKQGLRGARKLKQGDLYLYVGNGVRAHVEAIGSFDLFLPNGLVIWLDNCHYAPSITRGAVLVSCLVENRSVQCFMDFGISVSRNNVLYFNAIPSNGIYEIDMSNLVLNVNSIYNVSNKRVKHNLDSTYLWHYCLAHISKKRVEKLKQDRLLQSTDDESFDQCVSCLSGKMTRKSFPHRHERATDVLVLIHTDVCGLLRHVSRQGASYFTTFTDDYSRYGYIYLHKHKHKLTPPYTPQHNGVSKRRNHTLLDMVRSMMNLTTLPLSFWDYALEAAARILNMVPTKKVDTTPYELWFGKVPNLSYLKVWGHEALVKRDTPDKLQQRSVKCIFIGYPKKTMGYYFYFPPKNKIVVARYAEFFEKNLLSQEVSGRAGDLEEIQDEDTSPSEITSEIPMEVEEVEEHSLGDLNKPANSKAAMLDLESTKWLDAMNAEMQSMKDNQVWRLVDLPPNDLEEATFILGIKIYRDRSRRLIRLCQSAYMDKILKRYRMHNFKRGYIPMQERLDLNKTQGASTPEEVKHMQNVPYASAVGFIMSTRTRHAPDRMCLNVEANEYELGDLNEPVNYKAALLDPESDKWLNAMNVKIHSMKDNKVWDLVDLPSNGKTVGSKWLFRKKTDMDGVVHTYKARLVAKGFTQTYGVDYEETFSLVVYIRSIMILIAIAAFMTMRFGKWMSKLPSSIEEVYIVQPEGDIKRELRVSCYIDVGYPTDADDLKSQTGYVFVLNEGVVDWKSTSRASSQLHLHKLSI
nr:hypothetical protein [Tanacetum cinerariifolium]